MRVYFSGYIVMTLISQRAFMTLFLCFTLPVVSPTKTHQLFHAHNHFWYLSLKILFYSNQARILTLLMSQGGVIIITISIETRVTNAQ